MHNKELWFAHGHFDTNRTPLTYSFLYMWTDMPTCIVMAFSSVLLEMMMSVLQEVEGLTKKSYSIILPVERPVSMQNFRINVYTFFLF